MEIMRVGLSVRTGHTVRK